MGEYTSLPDLILFFSTSPFQPTTFDPFPFALNTYLDLLCTMSDSRRHDTRQHLPKPQTPSAAEDDANGRPTKRFPNLYDAVAGSFSPPKKNDAYMYKLTIKKAA